MREPILPTHFLRVWKRLKLRVSCRARTKFPAIGAERGLLPRISRLFFLIEVWREPVYVLL